MATHFSRRAMVGLAGLFLLSACASYYFDFDAKLNNAVGKTNEQIKDLPFRNRLASRTEGGVEMVEYAFLLDGFCKWRFYYDESGHILQWQYVDDESRYQCQHIARSRP